MAHYVKIDPQRRAQVQQEMDFPDGQAALAEKPAWAHELSPQLWEQVQRLLGLLSESEESTLIKMARARELPVINRLCATLALGKTPGEVMVRKKRVAYAFFRLPARGETVDFHIGTRPK